MLDGPSTLLAARLEDLCKDGLRSDCKSRYESIELLSRYEAMELLLALES